MPYTIVHKVPFLIKDVSFKGNPFKLPPYIYDNFVRVLKGLSKEVGKFIVSYLPTSLGKFEYFKQALTKYADIIDPWARKVSVDILTILNSQGINAWRRQSSKLSREISKQLISGSIAEEFSELVERHVMLIKSIPLEAVERVQTLLLDNLLKGERSTDLAKKIMETEKVLRYRAETIARTEISSASVSFIMVRSKGVGSEGYIWRIADANARLSHKAMNGRFIEWDKPPLINEGTLNKPNLIAHHAGCIWNCRCWAEPVIPGV